MGIRQERCTKRSRSTLGQAEKVPAKIKAGKSQNLSTFPWNMVKDGKFQGAMVTKSITCGHTQHSQLQAQGNFLTIGDRKAQRRLCMTACASECDTCSDQRWFVGKAQVRAIPGTISSVIISDFRRQPAPIICTIVFQRSFLFSSLSLFYE